MATNIFAVFTPAAATPIKFPTETLDKNYQSRQGAIEVKEVSFGIENPTTIGSTSGGAGAGKAHFKPVKFVRDVGIASPSLMAIAGSGGHFDTVIFEFVPVGPQGAGKPSYIVTCKMVFVTDIETDASADSLQETVTLAVGAMQLSYTPMLPTGAAGSASTAAWSQVRNTPDLTVA